MIGTTLIGIAGAFVGGWLSARFLDRPVERHFFDLYTWVAAGGGGIRSWKVPAAAGSPMAFTYQPFPWAVYAPPPLRM